MNKKNLMPIFAMLVFLPALALPVFAQEMGMEKQYAGIIWGNMPVMFLIDFAIIASAVFAAFFGLKLVSGKLKGAFYFIFAGVCLMAFNYILDILSMASGNMGLMLVLHLDIFWLTNAASFILITIGFYKMYTIFKKIGGGVLE